MSAVARPPADAQPAARGASWRWPSECWHDGRRALRGAVPSGDRVNPETTDERRRAALAFAGELYERNHPPEVDLEGYDPAADGWGFVPLADVDRVALPERRWIIDGYLSRGTVTGLFGPGGTGKSLLAQTVQTCVANGIGIFGSNVKRGTAIGLMCEDDADEIRRRQRDILRSLSRGAQHSTHGLLLESRVGLANELVTVAPDRSIVPTELYYRLRSLADAVSPSLIVIDNIAQTFPADENSRHAVTAYCNLLTGLAAYADCSILLIGHTAKAAGSEFSGSTAWDAAVRTRLWLERREDGFLELRRRKANYAGDASVLLEWSDGAIREVTDKDDADSALVRQAMPIIREVLEVFTHRQVATSHQPTARNNLITLGLREGLVPFPRAIATRALAALIDSGELVPNVKLPWRKADRHPAFGLAISEQRT